MSSWLYWRPSWKKAAILKFWAANGIFQKSNTYWACVPNAVADFTSVGNLSTNAVFPYRHWRPSWKWPPSWNDWCLTCSIYIATKKEHVCQIWCLIEAVLAINWEIMCFHSVNGGHLGKWPPFWKFRWLTGFFKRGTPTEHVCQIWCLYPEVKYYLT